MREVKEKSPLKERTVKTLKSAPQTAFRRGTDASFEQLRQELRAAAQDGQPEDRYESGKITDTADHAVQEVRHLAEKAAHRLPKTKSEPQREARTESVPQHEQSRQPTTVPREYPPVSAQPSYPPQSQPQVSRSVRESASPIREKPVPPANAPQPKMREHAPDAKAPVSFSQHATLRIHEKTQNVSAEIKPTPTGSAEKHTAAPFEQSAHHLQMERSAHEQAFPIKEKPVPPANTPQPKMREHTPTADAPVHLPQHPASQIYERPQNVYQLQTNRSVRELETSVREKPSASSLREIPAALKPDTTQFALPEIKAKEYIRSRRQKQHLLKEEASSIENTIADSETFSPVIRTRETVREQQKLHVSHSAEQEQPVMPQIRTRQPQAASMRANTEPVTPDAPRPPLPDIKSKQKYIAAQQPTQVTLVQASPQQAAQQAGKKAVRGERKLCQPSLANETVPVTTSRNVAPTKPVRVQKQARPAVARKQKIKTAPKAKIKSATPAAKALPSKASAAAPKQAATVIRKGQVLRDTAIKAAKVAKEAGKKVLRAIVATAEKLAAAIGAGGAAAVSVVVVILLVGMLFASPLGILSVSYTHLTLPTILLV